MNERENWCSVHDVRYGAHEVCPLCAPFWWCPIHDVTYGRDGCPLCAPFCKESDASKMTSTMRYWCPLHDVTHGPHEVCPQCAENGASKFEPPLGVLAACAGQVLDVLSKIVHNECRPAAERIAAADVILRWYKP